MRFPLSLRRSPICIHAFMRHFACINCLLWLTFGQAHAQGNAAGIGPKMQQQNECQHSVSKFEQTMGQMRQSLGNAKAAEFREKVLPSKLENDMLMSEGYCGLARYLKQRKLID